MKMKWREGWGVNAGSGEKGAGRRKNCRRETYEIYIIVSSF